jgi:hypothetical protein
MDKLLKYREHARKILEEHAHPSSDRAVETQVVIDEVRDHYLLLYIGWSGHERVRGCILHLDIKEGRIWVQYDGTEGGVANELVEMGVPKEDIILGFRAAYRRPLTGFGVAVEPGVAA